MKKHILYSIICFLCIGNIFAQQTPAAKQSSDYTIVGATAHIGNGSIIENSLIIFSKGKISYVGSANDKEIKKGTIIHAEGKHVYPGFIVTNTSLGLAEIDAVRATIDFDEVGTMLPHIRSIIAYNAESKIIETMRPNGVLLGQITPRGGTISGTSSVVQFDAWNWEDSVVKLNDAIHLNWPSIFAPSRKTFGGAHAFKPNKKYTENIKQIKTYFETAKNYLAGSRIPINLSYEAVYNLFNNKQQIFIHVSGEKGIVDAIDTFKSLGIDKIVLVQGDGAEKVADLLIKNNIPIILKRSHSLPSFEDEDYDLPYRKAKILNDAGILVGLGMEGNMERMSARNLPFYAGTYVAHGLNKEKAVQLITENNAKILGIDDKFGTLEVGKSATLFISEGDALDMRTNILLNAFIDGRAISLASHQTKLWKRYSNKYKTQ